MSFKIYTDGSCIGNPGPGGWGFVVIQNNKVFHSEKGSQAGTTNNRMEMMALIKALEYVVKQSLTDIEIYSDSRLLVNTINDGWKKKANRDLWDALDPLTQAVKFKIAWVKAHANNTFNNMVDELAFSAAKECPNSPSDEGLIQGAKQIPLL